jgi:hypothetical protein
MADGEKDEEKDDGRVWSRGTLARVLSPYSVLDIQTSGRYKSSNVTYTEYKVNDLSRASGSQAIGSTP